MSAVVSVFIAKRQPARPWQNRELAEFYRVIDILGRAGISVVPDMGVSDEGDPWFAFCRSDTGDVVVHCAHIDDQFVANSVAFDETFIGKALPDVIKAILKSAHFNAATTIGDKRLYLHPVAVFTAFIAAALLFSKEASAQTHSGAGHDHSHNEIAFQKVISAIKTAIADGLAGGPATEANTSQIVSEPLELAGAISLAAVMSATWSATPTIDSLIGFDASTSNSVPTLNQYDGYASIFDAPLNISASDTLEIFQQTADSASAFKLVLAGLQLTDTILAGGQSPPPPDTPTTVFDPTSSLMIGSNDANESHFTYTEAPPVHLVAAILAIELAAQNADSLVTPDGHPFALTEISPFALAILLGTAFPLDQTGGGGNGGGGNHDVTNETSPQSTTLNPVPSADLSTDQSGTVSSPTSSTNAIVSQTDTTSPGPTTIVLGQNPITGLEQILDYALGSHALSGTFTASASLEAAIANLTPSGSTAPVLLIFDSSSIKSSVFEFSPGVLLVDDQQIGITPQEVPVSNLVTVDLANGGTMTLLGVVQTTHLLI